uniref:Hemochromatosis protein n=1 Tax=Steinernema glaseri TaxID=37863 RepID=A0A1I7Y1W6_9BILA
RMPADGGPSEVEVANVTKHLDYLAL